MRIAPPAVNHRSVAASYTSRFRSAFLYYLFSAFAGPRSAIPAMAELLFPHMTLIFEPA